eukprot:4845314-Pleurochrysis_carterae.AAC.1
MASFEEDATSLALQALHNSSTIQPFTLSSQSAGHSRPVGLALYGRLNRKSVGSPEAVPLGSAPPTSGI